MPQTDSLRKSIPHNLNHLEIEFRPSPLFPGDYALPGGWVPPISIPCIFFGLETPGHSQNSNPCILMRLDTPVPGAILSFKSKRIELTVRLVSHLIMIKYH